MKAKGKRKQQRRTRKKSKLAHPKGTGSPGGSLAHTKGTLARGTGSMAAIQKPAFSDLEEAFFAEGREMCAAHASAPIVVVDEPPRRWWHRLAGVTRYLRSA